MYLVIDTSDKIYHLAISYSGKTYLKEYKRKNTRRQDLLLNIKKMLESKKLKPDQIKAIYINSGPGSFTGLRIGASIANAIGWNNNIPVLPFPNIKNKNIKFSDKIKKIINNQTKNKINKYIKPVLPDYN